MRNPYPDALPVTRRVLKILIRLNQLMGVFILAVLVASLAADGWVLSALSGGLTGRSPRLVMGMRLVMLLGFAGVPVTHVVLTRLLVIVETVAGGDPFVIENAARLKVIAWAVLGLELLHLAVGGVAASVSTAEASLDLGWNFSVTRWVAVLLLFVLARVFEQGSRMREDLAGTV